MSDVIRLALGRRINGPYRRGKKWRLVVADANGPSTTLAFDTEEEALRIQAAMRRAERDAVAVGVMDDLVLALVGSAVSLPSDPSWLYLLHDASGAVAYVGVTGSPRYRIRTHRENGVQFTRASWIPTAYERPVAMMLEALLIRTLDPPLNRVLKRPVASGNANPARVSEGSESEDPCS